MAAYGSASAGRIVNSATPTSPGAHSNSTEPLPGLASSFTVVVPLRCQTPLSSFSPVRLVGSRK